MRSNRSGYNNHNYRRTGNTYNRNISRNNRSYMPRSSSYRTTGNTSQKSYTRASMGRSSNREYGYYSNGYSGYNNTSVAHDFYYEPEVAVNHKRRVNASADKKEIRQLNMPKTIASIAVVFTLSLVLLCSYAVNSSYRGEIASKQAELAEIQEENQYLQTSLEDNLDLDKIEREAEKLGLQKPQAYQITEVQVPNESYTVQYDAQIATQDKSVWEFVKGLLKK